jgi:PAS domain S-box-containing protein
MSSTQSTINLQSGADSGVQGVLAALPVPAYSCDIDGRITCFNDRAEELWGRRPALNDPEERYCGSVSLWTLDGTRVPHDQSWTALALQSGNRYDGREIVLVRPDGSRRNVLAYVSPLHDDSGTLLGATTVLIDTTDQMQRELRRREREASDFFENGGIGIQWIDAGGIVIRANQAALDMLGYTAEEFIGQPMRKFHTHPGVLDDLLHRVGAAETVRNHEVRLIANGGRIRHVLMTCDAFFYANEFQHWRCFTVDVTAEKAAKLALQASEANFRGFFDSVCVGAVQVGKDGRFIRVNDRYCEITGYSREELLKMGPLDLDHPDDREADQERVAKFVAEIRGVYRAEKRYLRKDGSVAWVRVAANLLRDDSAESLHSAAIVEDISEHKLAEQAVQDADRLKDEFLATLAHELRNPLAPMQTAVELLHQPGADDTTWCHGVIERQVRHLTQLVDDLLDISRITTNKLAIHKQPIELADVMQAAVESTRPILERCEQQLVLAMPPAPLYLDGDLVRLAQVFANLLSNAAKFTEGPGIIRVSAEAAGREIRVRVRDTGVGMSEDDLSRVFDKFYQGSRRPARSFGGLGIGLSLARQLLELHGGTIEARSAGFDRGSEFVVRLPTRAGATPATAAATESSASSAATRILIVDDNRDGAEAIARLLRTMSHEVVTAYEGRVGLERAKTFEPDVVLLDLGMPGVDGFEVCRRLRAHAWSNKRPSIVALTGWGREADVARTKSAGFDAHLVKPVGGEALLKLLQRLHGETSFANGSDVLRR